MTNKIRYDYDGVLVEHKYLRALMRRLKGPRLAVFLGYHLFRASGVYPTTRDLQEATGLERHTTSEIYSKLVSQRIVAQPRCARCASKIAVRLLHRHHILPRKSGGKDVRDNYINICIVCHNRMRPR